MVTYTTDVVGKFKERFDNFADAYWLGHTLKTPDNTVLVYSSTGDLWEIEENGWRRVGF